MNAREPLHEVWAGAERGRLRTDWLDARLTLDFGGWTRAGRERFGPLRVLNDDRVAPRSGFGMHGHRDLDILMVPLSAPIEHRDSEGRRQWVRPGQIQWMRAGSGIAHSQMNASADSTDRHLQLWIEPRRRGLAPAVQVHDIAALRPGHWSAVAGRAAGLFEPDADIGLWLGRSAPGRVLTLPGAAARLLQVVSGTVQVLAADGGRSVLSEGDALVWHSGACPLLLRAAQTADLLRVDLPQAAR